MAGCCCCVPVGWVECGGADESRRGAGLQRGERRGGVGNNDAADSGGGAREKQGSRPVGCAAWLWSAPQHGPMGRNVPYRSTKAYPSLSEIDRSIDRTPKRVRAVLVRACSASRPPERHPAFRACCCCLLSLLSRWTLRETRTPPLEIQEKARGRNRRSNPKSNHEPLFCCFKCGSRVGRSGNGACGLLR